MIVRCACGSLTRSASGADLCLNCGRHLPETQQVRFSEAPTAKVSEAGAAAFVGLAGALYSTCAYLAASSEQAGSGVWIGGVGVLIMLVLGHYLRRNLE